MEWICGMFEIAGSRYHDDRRRRSVTALECLQWRSEVDALFNHSRGSAGSRCIQSMLEVQATNMGGFHVPRLMREAGFIRKQ